MSLPKAEHQVSEQLNVFHRANQMFIDIVKKIEVDIEKERSARNKEISELQAAYDEALSKIERLENELILSDKMQSDYQEAFLEQKECRQQWSAAALELEQTINDIENHVSKRRRLSQLIPGASTEFTKLDSLEKSNLTDTNSDSHSEDKIQTVESVKPRSKTTPRRNKN